MNRIRAALLSAVLLAAGGFTQSLPPEIKTKVDAKVKELQSWSTDPTVVAAVQAHNAHPPAEDQAMTNEKWANLSILDPYVRSFTKNPLATYLKTRKDDQISECFVSGADGRKIAFFAKTTSWSHADKPKHLQPMSGKTYVGPIAVDESTGQQEIQIGIPVLAGGKPIGSIVVGLAVAKLR